MAKGSFPGCLRKKITKKRIRNLHHFGNKAKFEKNCRIALQILENLQRFEELFGSSDEDDEFHGFSSEECGLIAYKHVSSSQGKRSIPGILSSPIDLTSKNVTTRLAHARRSLDEHPSSRRSKKRKPIAAHKARSKLQAPNGGAEANAHSSSLQMRRQSDHRRFPNHSDGFVKYNNSNLDFHRLSENATFRPIVSSKHPSTSKHKSSPIKPATFIAPSLANRRKHHVTNVTPTCLKIQISKTNKTGTAQSSSRSLLVRYGRSKAKSFVLPAKSSRSSRIIKANPKYLDSDDNAPKGLNTVPKLPFPSIGDSVEETTPSTSKTLPVRGRPLLKQPTFRVAALAKINDKPQTSRLVTKDSGISTRMRARKLIKRARFKHPTSSSTLIVGNDYDEDDIKKNLIREATFKMPSKSRKEVEKPISKSSDLSDLGLSAQSWKKLGKNEIRYNGNISPWTRQEIHNLLHGAHTFANSWSRIARHYEYQPLHRDWQSIKAKLKTLQNYGLLSSNLKVKSSVLLQLKHRYSTNPNVTVFTQQELKSRGMGANVECEANSVGEEDEEEDTHSEFSTHSSQTPRKSSVSLQKYHIQCYKKWTATLSTNPPNSQSVYLGLEKKVFLSLCVPQRLSIEQEPWSVREIHNIIHGFHIFGTCEWSMVHKLYVFQKTHDITAIRTRFKVIKRKGVIVRGQVKSDVLQLLQPLLSVAGKKYYELSPRTCRVAKGATKQEPSEPVKRNEKRETTRKRSSSMSENDMKSPPRKQAYHLFGTVPVWDNSSSASGLNHLEDSLSESEQEILEQKCGTKRKSGRGRKESSATSAKKEHNSGDDKSFVSSRGPRIKHVCRRASLVTGQNIAVYSDEQTNLHLSALPKKEREKIAAEVEKHRDAPSDTTVSSDSEGNGTTAVKRSLKRSDRLSKIVGRRKRDKVPNRSRCKMCKNCQAPKCGVCDYCKRDVPEDFFCLGLPPCLNPPVNVSSKKSTIAQKNGTTATSCMDTRKSSTPCLYERQPNSQAKALGILLSPDSRRRLQQELQEQARQSPSIVKIDEWKERYEMEDLWTTGGVSIITSTTPSTRFLCFLCGSVGKARPMRRSSVESDSSADSIDNYDQKPLFIFCCSCCEPFHPFCLDDHEQQAAINSAKKGTWICKRCQFCNVCGRTDNLLECKRCSKTYHSNCLGPGYPNKQSKNHVWVCMRCVRCRSCGASKPGQRPGSKWTHDFQLCQRCGDLFDKGNFCPICRRCYRDEDYESRMVQCGTCKRWVHSRCESLTNEMYALLSHLPDDVQYVCPDCDGRRNKVEIEFSNSCESVMVEDVGSDSSLEGDKMKTMLQNLPSPPWKNILENEVQSGIESVMMALFHNKDAACILKKTVQEDSDGSRPADLFAVRFAVHNRRYSSVSQFSSDVCNILDTTVDEGSSDIQSPSQGRKKRQHEGGPRNAFFKEMQQVFPWFDIETGRVKDTSDVPEDLLPHATLPPHSDHNYAQWQDRDIAISAVGPETPLKNTGCEISFDKDSVGMVLWSLVSNSQFDDRRQCLFCGKYGDDMPTIAGRLVYCGQDEWVHVNCALWSAEVFERHDGSLQNVYSAVSRGRMMKCELCKLPGATVGCNTRDCPQNFHFACAKLAQCSFQNDKKVFCPKHTKNIDAELVTEDGFEVARRVVVDSDEMRPNKRWQRGVQSDNVTILMGSAIVHQLGHLTMASDSKEYLIPVHFRMTRMFWSTVHAGRKVRYTITVTEQKSTLDAVPSSKSSSATQGEKVEHGNHTISHSDEREQTKKKNWADATACKSNLLSRLQDAESKAQGRRKSRDEARPKAPRSRRFSGTSYTVVGLSNRTMPQNITPLPSSLVTAPTLQPQVAAKPAATRQFSIDEEIKDAVVVSHQNPYLNIQIGKVNQTVQGAHDPKSDIRSDILKAMDRCLMDNQQKMQQVSEQNTAPSCVDMVHSQPTINHGSSGSLICDYKESLEDTIREKSLVDSSKVLTSGDKEIQSHTRKDENNMNILSDPGQRFGETHSPVISEAAVNSSTNSDSGQRFSISAVDHSENTPLQCSANNNISSNTETDKCSPTGQICEAQPTIDDTSEKICQGNAGRKTVASKLNIAKQICESHSGIVSTLEKSCSGNSSHESETETSNLNIPELISESQRGIVSTLEKSYSGNSSQSETETSKLNIANQIRESQRGIDSSLKKSCSGNSSHETETETSKLNIAKQISESQRGIDSSLKKSCSENSSHESETETSKLNIANQISESQRGIDSTLKKSCSGNSSHESETDTSNVNIAEQICEPCLPVDSTLGENSHGNEESLQCNLIETIGEPTPTIDTALEKICSEKVIHNSETETLKLNIAEQICDPKPDRGSKLGKNCSEKDIHGDETPKLNLIEPLSSIDSSLEKSCFERDGHGDETEASRPNCQQQMHEVKTSCDSRLEKKSVGEQPVAFSINVSQEAEDNNNDGTAVSQSSIFQSSTKPNAIKLLRKSKKNDTIAGTRPVIPNTRTDDDESLLVSDSNKSIVSPRSIIITRLKKSKSIDSLSDDVYTDNISLEEEQQSFKLQSSSVKELKVVLHDIKGVDSKLETRYGKTISDELLGRKDELFTDSVRSSDSSSIDSSSIPDMNSPHADVKRKSSQSRKKRLRNFAKSDKSASGNDFQFITRSKKHFSSKSSGKSVSHDRISAKSKKGTAEVCHRTSDGSGSKRGRSWSYDSTMKIKQQNQENERRYPRRNPFTCLRSFSGLSPNYAIQSYSLKTTDNRDHPNSTATSGESSNALTRPSRKNTKSARKKSNNKETNSERKISTSQHCCVTVAQDASNPASTEVPQETRLGSVLNDRTTSQNLGSSKTLSSDEESQNQLDNNSSSHCDIATNSATVTSRSEFDSTVSKVNPQICDDEQQRNAGDDSLKGHPDAKAHVPDVLSSLSENSPDEEFPPIEVERGIIESGTKSTAPMNVDDSDAEAVSIKEKDAPRPPLPNSPIVVFTSNNDDRFPVTSPANLSTKNSNDVSTLCEVDQCASVQTSRISNANETPVATDLPVTKEWPMSKPEQLRPVLNFHSLVDIDSPLSPRDEPNLPLPVETEATASSFLVTSECPVLNVDEVRSILAMPPTGTVTSPSLSLLPSSVVPSVSCDERTLNVGSRNNLINSPASFQSAACIQQQYVPLNVQTFDSPYQQTPKVLMKYDGRQAYLLCRPKPVLASPQLHPVKKIESSVSVVSRPLNIPRAQTTYQYMQPRLVYPAPVIRPQPVYVATPATPMIPVVKDFAAVTPQSQRFQYPVSPSVTLPLQSVTAVNDAGKHHDISQVPKQPFKPNTEENTVATSISVPSTQGSLPVESHTATASQMHTLEKMIEFFSNKNNLSVNEKQIVRAIIAQHIRNQSLPLPTPDDSQVIPTTSAKSAIPTEDSSAKNSKRKPSKNSACKKSKRPREEPLQCNSINTKTATTDKDSMQRSPLLDIYMKVMNAESSNNYSLMKKLRDNVRHLLKYHISLDIPLYARRSSRDKQAKLPPPPPTPKHAELVYEITSDDGYHAKGTNLRELIMNLLDAVQECRSDAFIPPNSLCLASVISPHAFLGISQDAIRFLVEQLQGAKHCQRYKAKYYKHKESIPEVVTHINPHGCARAEKYQGRSKPDMFSFLASKHRLPPSYDPSQTQNVDMQQNSTRRPTSMDLPMAMRFRHLKTSAREAVGVYRSAIHGRGLFCKRDIEAGEMVMEYTGEVIRCFLTDRREKMYESKGIGCYMFRMDDTYVIDATMTGSGTRFINHSCEPSCYSRIVSIDGRKHIIIFALRKILRGEELTYDYKFPIEAEDQKIMCNCGSKTCRKYMN